MAESVLLSCEGGVATLCLAREARHNAFDDGVLHEMNAALRDVAEDERVRVLVLAARGETFCAGADLDWMRLAAAWSEDENRRDAQVLADLLWNLAALPKPTVAAIQGPAFGGGVGLIAACDIAIACASARFTLSEVRLGLIPAVIGPYVLAAIGLNNSRHYMLTGSPFSAAEAKCMGLVQQVVPDREALQAAVAETCHALLQGGPSAQAECKSMLRSLSGLCVSEDLAWDTADRIARVRCSAEAQEGIHAFMQKRKPNWRAG